MDRLPLHVHPGDVVKMRRVKIQSFQGSLQGLSSKGFEAFVYRKDQSAWTKVPGNLKIDALFLENIRIGKILGWFHALSASNALPKNCSKKRLLSNEIKPGLYFDHVGEVLKVFRSGDDTDCLSVILTDYTSNPMFRPMDLPEVSLFASDICLVVSFWDDHVELASSLRVGQIVLLQNLHSRLVSPLDHLVAVLHGFNQQHPSRPSIQALSTHDPDVLALQRYALHGEYTGS
jgi:hypothetical protein